MSSNQTVVINGRLYDALSGLPLQQPEKGPSATVTPDDSQKGTIHAKQAKPVTKVKVMSEVVDPAASRRTAPAKVIRAKIQKSSTLRRDILKKPARTHPVLATKTRKIVPRSGQVSRFAPPKTLSHPKDTVDHELVTQARAIDHIHASHQRKQALSKERPVISSRAVKEHLLQKGLQAAVSHKEVHRPPHRTAQMSRRTRLTSVGLTSLALVLLGGYLTYINIPNLSIRVAAANAGIDAQLPHYQPAGYRIHGAIAYAPGEVEVSYQQNGGRSAYSLTQKATDWDSQTTLDNYVEPDSHDEYQIYSVQGLTVYTYDNKAVWVNEGLLHIIDGNVGLSARHIKNIVASM